MTAVLEAPTTDLPMPCPRCGYDLRGATTGRCPECGGEVDLSQLRGVAQIPWQLADRGRLRAFIQTLWLLVRRPGEVVAQVDRSVDYRNARTFQAWCCGLGTLPAAGVIVYGLITLIRDAGVGSIGDWLTVAAVPVGIFLWLLLATGAPSYFCHPRGVPIPRQDAAIALSYYASAGQLLIPIAAVLTVPAFITTGVFLDVVGGLSVIAGVIASWILMLLAWLLALWRMIVLPARIVRQGLGQSRKRAAAQIIVSLLAWPILLVLIGFGVPFVVFYVQVVYHAVAG